MKLNDLRPAPGAHRDRKKIGRGPGSGHGKTSGRGHKGDKARGNGRPGFEGGQTPLNRRLPKQRGLGVGLTARGFNTGRYKTHYAIVNIGALEAVEAGTVVTPELLRARGLVRRGNLPVKVLADGKLTRALTVRAHKFSQGAQAAIEAAGGTAEAI